MKVVLIGVGNMGSAMLKAWNRAGIVDASDLTLFDTNPVSVDGAAQASLYGDEREIRITAADVVVLAIKPQDLDSAAARLAPLLSPSSIILSILAGVALQRLGTFFPANPKIVRAMPNIGARISQSMSAYVVSSAVEASDAEKAAKLLAALGPVECLQSEDLMDAWCAVAGSGPGFVLALMESFVSAAVKQGFSARLAEQMVTQTFFGTVSLVQELKLPLEDLRKSVVSKGGTTAAGLEVFKSRNVAEIIEQTVQAATNRGKDLNK